MKRCKRPTEPGWYWNRRVYFTSNESVQWEPVKVTWHKDYLIAQGFGEQSGHGIAGNKEWWGPKIGGIDPK